MAANDLLVKIGVDVANFQEEMRQVSQTLKQTVSSAENSLRGFDRLGQNLSSFGATLSVAITAPLVALGLGAIKVASDMQVAEKSFTTLLGSAQAAGNFLGELKSFAAQTPFEFPELVDASKRMLAMGFAAKDIVPDLRIIGDQVAALGGGSEMINRVTLALGQMGSKGKVSAQEMNQLAESGIPAWKYLAEAIGVSIPEAMKLAEKGAISSATAIPAILAGMKSQTEGQMKGMSDTIAGQWSNIKDQITFTLADIGKALTPFADRVLDSMRSALDVVKNLAAEFANLSPAVQDAIIATAGIAAAIGPVVFVAGQMITAFSTVGKTIFSLNGIITKFIGEEGIAGISSSLTSMGGVLSVVSAGVLLLGGAWATWESLKEIPGNFKALVDEISQTEIWSSVKGLVDDLKTSFGNLIAALPTDSIAQFFTDLGSAIAGVAKDIGLTGFITSLKDLWNAIDPLAKVTDLFREAWAKFNFADSISPIGWLNTALKDLKENLHVLNGGNADMDKAAKDMSVSLQEAANKTNGFSIEQLQAQQAANKHAEALTGLGSKLSPLDQALKDLGLSTKDGTDKASKLTDEYILVQQAFDAGKISTETMDAATAKFSESMSKLTGGFTAALQPVDEVAKALAAFGLSSKDGIDKSEELRANMATLAEAYADGKISTDDYEAATKKFFDSLAALGDQAGKTKGPIQDLQTAQKNLSLGMDDVVESSRDLSGGTDTVTDKFVKFSDTLSGQMYRGMSDVHSKQTELFDAMRQMGIPTLEDTQKQVDTLRGALDLMKGSVDGNGRSFTDAMAAEQLALTQATQAEKDYVTDSIMRWSNLYTGIHDTVKGTFDSMVHTLITGKGSFGDEMIGMLQNIGEAVVNSFLKPFENAVAQLISGAITDLLSGKGLGGIMDSITNIGKSLGGLFGAGSSAASGATGAAGAAGQAAGAAGSAGSAASGAVSGLTGIFGAVGSIASAVSGIIGNFQFAGMNKTLDLIEHSTRYSQIFLNTLVDKANETWPVALEIKDALWNGVNASVANVVGELYKTTPNIIGLHDMVATNLDCRLSEVRDAMNSQKTISISVPISLDGREIANSQASYLLANGVRA